MFNIAIVLIIHACYKKINDKRRATARLFIFPKSLKNPVDFIFSSNPCLNYKISIYFVYL